ncbi:MAG TPA: hypothetical protein VLA37_09340 [Sphingomonadaceae bacterium]|nr:hypothetical protein [Sphingomonadaceae bacterium]
MNDEGPYERCWLALAGLEGKVRRGWEEAAPDFLRDFRSLSLDDRERLVADTNARTRTELEGYFLADLNRNCASYDPELARNRIADGLWLVSLANFDIDSRDEILTFEEFLRAVSRAGLYDLFEDVWAELIPLFPERIVTLINARIRMGIWRD